MKKDSTINTFQEGLMMDFNPLVTPANVMTNALNATLLTMNGNENVLLNDMGNGRVETAYLPEGYVPVGTCSFGGIIYIVSYNPLLDRCQIGSFPSPERNITTDELVNLPKAIISNKDFQEIETEGETLKITGNLKSFLFKVNLLDPDAIENITKLNPGDKYAIYCLNGQVSGNKDSLSDAMSDENWCYFDHAPRNLTIHVVTISDDGKITYLDDTLKWSEITHKTEEGSESGYYYIKEMSNTELNLTADVDSYRTLVSSAYNVFRSRVSGTLALLCELRVIDSFSVTWDADVNDETELGDELAKLSAELSDSAEQHLIKEATIKFYLNWTSDSGVINAKYAILTKSVYTKALYDANSQLIGNPEKPKDETVEDEPVEVDEATSESDETASEEVKPEWSCDLYPDKADNKEADSGGGVYEIPTRANIGYDDDVPVEVGKFKYDALDKLNIYEWTYEVTPAMKFGKIAYLAKSNTINFLDIGSGKMLLNEWRYYIQENSFYLSYGLQLYPEKNKKVTELVMTFIPFWKCENVLSKLKEETETDIYSDEDLKQLYENTDDARACPQIILSDRNSYSGAFQELILFDSYSRIKNSTITKNNLYLVDLALKYDSATKTVYRHFFRWLYTTTLWNDVYLHSDVLDFNDLYLNDVLTFDIDYNVKDNIKKQTDYYDSLIELPRELTQGGSPYDYFGAMVTTVNWDEKQREFISNEKDKNSIPQYQPSIEVAAVPKVTSYPELFKFEVKAAEQVGDADKYIGLDTIITKSYLVTENVNLQEERVNKNTELVTPLLKEPEKVKSDSTKYSNSLNWGESESEVIQLEPPTDSKGSGPTGFASIVSSVIEKGITSKKENEAATDLLKAMIHHEVLYGKGEKDVEQNYNFQIDVHGALFTKIIGILDDKTVQVLLTLKPLIFQESDIEKFGLQYDSDHKVFWPLRYEVTKIWRNKKKYHLDHFGYAAGGELIDGGGYDTGGKKTSDNCGYFYNGKYNSFYHEIKGAMLPIKGFGFGGWVPGGAANGGGAHFVSESSRNNHLNTNAVLNHLTDKKGLRGLNIWVWDEDFANVLPIDCYFHDNTTQGTPTTVVASTVQEAAARMFALYISLYQVIDELTQLVLPVVDNILWVNNYREIYNIALLTKAKDLSTLYVSLNAEGHTEYLSKLAKKTEETKDTKCKYDLDTPLIKPNNLKRTELDESKDELFPEHTISHTFVLINDTLYTTVNNAKTTERTGMRYSNRDTDYLFYDLSCNPNYLYTVTDDGLMCLLSSNKYNIYKQVQITIDDDEKRVLIDMNPLSVEPHYEKLTDSYTLLDYLKLKDGKLCCSNDGFYSLHYVMYFAYHAKKRDDGGQRYNQAISRLTYSEPIPKERFVTDAELQGTINT